MKTASRILAIVLAVMLVASLALSVSAANNVQTEEKSWLMGWFVHNGTRNNFHSFIGIEIQVGGQDVHMTQLGRMCYEGNTEEHVLKVVDAETKETVATTTVNMAGATAGQFVYGQLEAPATLSAGKNYYLLSEEHFDGDQFAEHGFRCDAAGPAAAVGAVFYLPEGEGSYNPDKNGPYGYVGLDFKYTMDQMAPTGTVLEAVGEKQITENLRNNFDTRIGTAFTVGSKDIYVTELGRFFWNGNTQEHYVCIVDAATGKEVINSGIFVPAGGTHGEYTWGKLANPVKLEAGKSYYIVSNELNGGDTWLEGGSSFTGTEGVTLTGSAYWLTDHYEYAANTYFNGTNLKYAYGVENVVEQEPVDPENPDTGDISLALPLALLAVSGCAIVVLKKKEN